MPVVMEEEKTIFGPGSDEIHLQRALPNARVALGLGILSMVVFAVCLAALFLWILLDGGLGVIVFSMPGFLGGAILGIISLVSGNRSRKLSEYITGIGTP